MYIHEILADILDHKWFKIATSLPIQWDGEKFIDNVGADINDTVVYCLDSDGFQLAEEENKEDLEVRVNTLEKEVKRIRRFLSE